MRRALLEKLSMYLDLARAVLRGAPASDRFIPNGTVAAMVYDLLRVPSVHSLGAPGGIALGSRTFQGELIGRVSFEEILDVLEDAIGYARARSEKTGKWFGHG